MSDREQTCAERIGAEFTSTMDTVRNLAEWHAEGNDEYHPDEETTLYEYGLCADYVAPNTFDDQAEGFFRWQISWGGPSDEFRFYVSPERYGVSVDSVEYRFHDWFDGAGVDLDGDDLQVLKNVFDMLFADPMQMIENADED